MSSTPSFGTNQNTPFLFQTPSRQPSQPYPWVPPPNFSPSKAFPQPSPSEELRDVDMSEVSPPKPEDSPNRGRLIATGALRRVYRARQQAGSSSKLSRSYSREDRDDEQDVFDDSDPEDDHRAATPVAHNTSNHYTLNMPSPPPPQSDTPYILLGYASPSAISRANYNYNSRYLQFFFNLSLILVFLYLVVQFILTVQRDVEHRISEYSQGKHPVKRLTFFFFISDSCRHRPGDRIMCSSAQK